MTDSMKKFLELASGNEALAAKLNGASKDEIIVLAKEAGFILTEADFEAPRNVEISDDELDVVTGGRGSDPAKNDSCSCTSGSGGGFYISGDYGIYCRCTYGGYGEKEKIR